MAPQIYTFNTRVWKHEGHAGWHFITVPKKISRLMSDEFGPKKRGWGSIPVMAQIGMSRWSTSVFPDLKTGCYMMGIKAEIRKKEGVKEKSLVRTSLSIRGVQFQK